MSTNTALDQIKARVEGHSATPWQVEPYLHSMYDRVRVTSPDDGPDFNTAEDVLPADAELIAAAPKLLAALEAVEAEAAALDALADEVMGDELPTGLRLAARGIRKAIEEALR
ncbi:MAG: hypothetical protein ABS910_05765 [Arthrobacter sp.]